MKSLFTSFQSLDLQVKKMISGNMLGNYKSAFHGKGLEFQEFRHREEGEDSENIDWFISSREGKILTRRMQEERDLSVLHIIDITPSMYFGIDEKKKFDLLEQTIFLTSLSALQNGDKNAYSLFFEGEKTYFPYSKKKSQLFQVFQKLENLKNKVTKNKDSGLQFDLSVKNNLIFIYTDSFELDREKLKILALRNDIIIVHIFDQFENTLFSPQAQKSYFLFSNMFGSTLNIESKDSEKSKAYQSLRQKKISDFTSSFASIGVDYIMLDDSKSPFKEFFQCMNRRQILTSSF